MILLLRTGLLFSKVGRLLNKLEKGLDDVGSENCFYYDLVERLVIGLIKGLIYWTCWVDLVG